MQEGRTPSTKPAAAPREGAEEEVKKRYYNPVEVMKKKGCIGCGGMVLSIPALLVLLAWAITSF